MNERLTIQDLTNLLAAKHSMTKKDAEAFVREFFLLIEQALLNDNSVKIKGLGTFKLIDVDSRESVNVHTGERFQIKGHAKVSFTPDANLRDTINKPFAHFETVVLNENTVLEDTPEEDNEEEEAGEETLVQAVDDKETEDLKDDSTSAVITENEIINENTVEEVVIQEEEIINNPSTDEVIAEEPIVTESISLEETIIQAPEEPVVLETPNEEKAEVEEEIAPVVEQQPDLTEEKNIAEKIIAEELLKANLKPEAPMVSPEMTMPAKPAVTTSRKKAPKKEKSPVPYLITIIVIVLLLCGGAILFIYYPDLFSSSSSKDAAISMPDTTQPVQPETQLSDTVGYKDSIVVAPDVPPKEIVETQPVVKEEKVVTSEPAKADNNVVQQPSTSAYLDTASYKITGTKTKYTIKEGETLTRVSLRFYGTKAMWPYIVKHNPDVIKNPNNVPYGTTVKIPELTKEK